MLLQPGEVRTGGDGGADLRFADLVAGADGTFRRARRGDRRGRLAEKRLQLRKRFRIRVVRGGELDSQDNLRSLHEAERGVVETRKPRGSGALEYRCRGRREHAAPAWDKGLDA